MKAHEAERLVKDAGGVILRQRGPHRVYQFPSGRQVVLPNFGSRNRPVSPNVAHIVKRACDAEATGVSVGGRTVPCNKEARAPMKTARLYNVPDLVQAGRLTQEDLEELIPTRWYRNKVRSGRQSPGRDVAARIAKAIGGMAVLDPKTGGFLFTLPKRKKA